MRRQHPTIAEETALWSLGYRLVAGVDEVGRGCLAGDVMAAAAILPADSSILSRLHGVRDSKQMTARQRAALYERIQAEAVALGLGRVPAAEIDRLGIMAATRQAMTLAVMSLPVRPDFLIIDALRLPGVAIPQKPIIRGDAQSLSIAAASVYAKVCRDRWMAEMDSRYPGYGFAHNKGYGTAMHLQALRSLRPCDLHRRSFLPVRAAENAAAC